MKKIILLGLAGAITVSQGVFANTNDKITSNQSYNMSVITGDNSNKKILVKVELDGRHKIAVSKNYINDVAEVAFTRAKSSGLKNPYSLKPREVIVEQVSNTLEVIAKYTAENSYGADVPGEYRIVKFLGRDGLYHDKPE